MSAASADKLRRVLQFFEACLYKAWYVGKQIIDTAQLYRVNFRSSKVIRSCSIDKKLVYRMEPAGDQ